MVATALTFGTIPAHSEARAGRIDVTRGVGRDVGHDADQDLAIGLGISTGVVALVVGAIWYYVHNRHTAPRIAPTGAPPEGTAAPSSD